MSYIRVIPRDLFNEGNLLKCYGQIYINLERLRLPAVTFDLTERTAPFDVQQDAGDGSLWIKNVELRIGETAIKLRRPMNSREPWPLMVVDAEDTETPVFNDDGSFSDEMLQLLGVVE